MDAVLPEVGRVSEFWRSRMSGALNETLAGRVVWNLLPGSHEKAWDDDHSYKKMMVVEFLKEQKGERKALTHDVKPLRGQFVNYIVRETLEDLEGLAEWTHPEGYRYDPEASDFDEDTRVARVVMVKKV